MTDVRRRLRGTIRNAAAWAIGWGVLGFATHLLLRLTGLIDAPVSVSDAAVLGLKIGIGGAIAGTAFSAFIAYAYRNRRIQDIRWWRFGLGGAAVTVASITVFVQGASLLSGSGLVPWRYAGSTTAMFALFGFGVAALSVKLEQLAPPSEPGSEQVLRDDARSAELAAGAGEEVSWRHPAQAAVHGRARDEP